MGSCKFHSDRLIFHASHTENPKKLKISGNCNLQQSLKCLLLNMQKEYEHLRCGTDNRST